jgi:hypothetical protein
MKSYVLILGLLTSGFALPANAQPNFLYINNDAPTNNTVSAYWVNHAGVPTELPGSPFATGGNGTNGPGLSFNPPQITTAKHFLYAANDFDSNIAAFEIKHDGRLETVAGSPFAAGTVKGASRSTGRMRTQIGPGGRKHIGPAAVSEPRCRGCQTRYATRQLETKLR